MDKAKPVTMSIGDLLWDILPDGKALGGSPANAAWHASQLGADAHIASAVGDDDLGREMLAVLKAKNLDVDAIDTVDKPTSTVTATVDAHGNATYIIHEDIAWDYIKATPRIMELAAKARGINFGSLAQRCETTRAATHAVLDALPPDSVRVFDINLRVPFIFKDILDAGMRKATVVKMNDDELMVLSDLFGWPKKSGQAIDKLLAAYPGLRHVVVTRGADGAWWHNRKRLIKRQPPAQQHKIVDTIGAGDSVTAVTLMGLLKGWEEEAILESALAIASFVCTRRGGMPELPEELKRPFLQ